MLQISYVLYRAGNLEMLVNVRSLLKADGWFRITGSKAKYELEEVVFFAVVSDSEHSDIVVGVTARQLGVAQDMDGFRLNVAGYVKASDKVFDTQSGRKILKDATRDSLIWE